MRTAHLLPMPCFLPITFRALNRSKLSVHSLPSELTLTGRPFSKRTVISCGVFGAVKGSSVRVHMPSGGGRDTSSSCPLS